MSHDHQIETTSVITCSVTGESRETKPGKRAPKLPRGWKWLPNGEPISPEGLALRYQRVAIRMTVVGVVDPETGNRAANERSTELWRELRARFRASRDDVARAGNAILSELYASEQSHLVRPNQDGKIKLPNPPNPNVYQLVRQHAPYLDTRSAVSLQQRINQLYRADRWELLRGVRSLRSLKPERQPVPIHNQGVRLDYLAPSQQLPVVTLPLRGERWSLVLSVAQTGARRRGRAGLAKNRVARLIDREGWVGEAMLYERHQAGTNRDNSFKKTDLIVQIGAWVPRDQQSMRHLEGTLHCRSVPDALLVCVDEHDERIWKLNADQMLKWHMAHLRQLERWREDRKREQRPVPSFAHKQRDAVVRHKRRMQTQMHEYARQLINYAKRRRVAEIRLDLTDRSYALGKIPWHDFVLKLRQKADQCGIGVEVV